MLWVDRIHRFLVLWRIARGNPIPVWRTALLFSKIAEMFTPEQRKHIFHDALLIKGQCDYCDKERFVEISDLGNRLQCVLGCDSVCPSEKCDNE